MTDTRRVAGFVIDTKLDGDVRIVTFFNEMVVREHIISVNDAEMRLAWDAEASGLDHYNGSVQVLPGDKGSCENLWIADLLPHENASDIDGMMERGIGAMSTAFSSTG